MPDEPGEPGGPGGPERPRPRPQIVERGLDAYGRGVRTALRDNATAYGFSISVTAAYGLAGSAKGAATAAETVTFAVGAALAFVLVGLAFVARFGRRRGRLREDEQVLLLSSGIDLLSVCGAVAAAYGLSRIPGFAAWPLTGLGTVVTYLLVGGLDVLLARTAAPHTDAGRTD